MGTLRPSDDAPTSAGRLDPPVAVVHLIRSGTGLETFERFLNSYRAHPAGMKHRLILLLKGFPDASTELDLVRNAAADLAPEEVSVTDDGFDLRAYFEVVHRVSDEWLCFLNSFSVIRRDDWLATLHAAASTDGVGIAGATGSWASMRSHAGYYLAGTGRYRRVFGDRQWFRAQTRAIGTPSTGPEAAPKPLHRRARSAVRQLALAAPFPNAHLRTNGFVASRETLTRVRPGPLRDKQQHLELESSRRSLTSQIASMGLRTVMCGADGATLDPGEWAESEIFWQGEQRNLLIGDNQTELYARGDPDLRGFLSRFAWGAQAHPTATRG